ncbi:MAG: bifunctional hydroxymethylpyrimidine kinase/phosphomethylpyrimidine kinase [Zestosphaera tikiterensis]|uniref:Bifunctional hydroxymethylpyrimidine kinase/phosphomethylpyrimidine kinase n=1 Tax=Zestosphaera tikiterensis TaxID=1973259 RepID=A0A2R7Y821_9CREN|nr:MAG: bifunctional hydroxymethylpyrimidine kinase/phosphomethylpyrimidine kinase [Zestosphaera tikiterensis]
MLRSCRRIPVAMTIAGSDSGGGAGIEADLKTFAALGVHGTVALTSVTAQNTYEVTAIYDIPPDIVYKQIEAVVVDMGVDAAKTGMLSNSQIIKAVAEAVRKYRFPVVVDPVMIAKSGAQLLREEAVETLVKELIPLAKVVTPNRPEAEKLTGVEIRSLDDAKLAAKDIVEVLGAEAAVVKGGHLEGSESIDVLYWNGSFKLFKASRIDAGCTHGTGCAFAAAIAAELAKGEAVDRAVEKAKEFITLSIDYGVKIGKGHCPVNPIAWLEIPAERYRVLRNVEEAVRLFTLNADKVRNYMPEVGVNIVEAIDPKYLRDLKDVAGVLGRIVKVGDEVKAVGPVRFGASKHLARALIVVTQYYPMLRAMVNIRYDEKLIENAVKAGFEVIFVDRSKEPEEVKKVEGMSLKWVVQEAMMKSRRPPDIIYDLGDVGKEAMIRVLARNAVEAVEKLLKIINLTLH